MGPLSQRPSPCLGDDLEFGRIAGPYAVDSKSKGFEVWLANGVSLEVPAGLDEGELQRLVGVLSGC